MKYSVLYKSVSISVCNTSSRFSYEFRHFGWTNKLTCEKKKTNFRNGGKICLPRAPTSSSLLRIVNSNFYRTATHSYDETQRRRRVKVVSSLIPQRDSTSLLSESFSTAFSTPFSFFPFILQHLAKWFILLHVKHFFPWAGHFILPPACGKVPPQEKHTFPAVLLCACCPSVYNVSSGLVSVPWLCRSISILFAGLSDISWALAKSRASVRVWGLLSNRRLTADPPRFSFLY